jgi:nitrite reductase/ring-hydroxylating ferredoxin subunit
VIPRVTEELAPDQTSRGLRFSDRRNIVCPWHGWEFDIETGQALVDPRVRAQTYPVTVEDEQIVISI